MSKRKRKRENMNTAGLNLVQVGPERTELARARAPARRFRTKALDGLKI
jgi:hypothetical protein